MTIGKRTREQAAMICAIAASNPPMSYSDVAIALGIGIWPSGPCTAAERLACDAFGAAYKSTWPWPVIDAEAEALLRTGWTP